MALARPARLALRAALVAGPVASLGACAEPYEPHYLFRGQWVDIDGQGRGADETCAGTFAYVDAYAGALAAEFGVAGHLGDYRWYSEARYDEELCPEDETDDSAQSSWTIPAGAAQFMIAGLSHELGANRLMAQNTQPIELREVNGVWTISSLELSFVDGAQRVWSVDVDPSSWRG